MSVERAGADPIPRRDLHDRTTTSWTLLAGIGIGGVMCVLNLLVSFKTGVGFGGSAFVVLLGAALLRVRDQLTWPLLFTTFSIASSGYLATAAVDTGVAAIALRGGAVPPVAVLIGLAVAANMLGVLLGILLSGSTFRHGLPFPALVPAITLMRTLTGEVTRSGRVLLLAVAAGAATSLAAAFAGPDATPDLPALPPYLSFALSPLLAGVGALIGVRSASWLLVGCGYTVAMWLVLPAGPVSYSQHLADAWILPVGVGIVLGYSVATLLRGSRTAGGWSRGPRQAGTGTARLLFAGVAVLGTVPLALRYGPLRGVALAGLLTAMVLLFALFLVRAGAEIGIAPMAPVLFLGVVVLRLVGLPPTDAVLLAAFVTCTGISSVYYVYAARIWLQAPPDVRQPPRRNVTWTQAVGGIMGATVGVLAVVLLIRSGAVGSASLPVPVVQTVDFIATSTLDGRASPALGVAAALGFGLAFASAPVTSIGLGVLLPPAYTVTMAVGGVASWLLVRRRPDRAVTVSTVASGLVIGEGLVMTALVAARLLW
ncbi:hypothetical protein O7627_33810 [Solwaraspora sp. WMMD1047]|uniref:hypothetical protein n=1 Tax=Solwaraspora sp. WMMD1047 TaxID=3016102 RepID=UPI00241658DE|nr:hypothetical protein [Solwaraspora sp. WMMD1047]MDG4834243.1 hypothetical protein [Solwaraspora sp. WMMD1047]